MGTLVWTFLAAGYQAAFFGLTSAEINDVHEAEAETGRYRLLHRLMDRPKLLYSTLHLAQLVGVISWLVVSTLLAVALLPMYPPIWVALSGVLAGMVLYSGLELPVRLSCARHRLVVLRSTSAWVAVLIGVFYPLAYLYRLGLRLLQRTAPHAVLATGTERLTEAIQQQREEDSPEEEKAILKALVRLNAIPVRSILRARVDVQALDLEATADEVLALASQAGHSRLPVYEGNLDTIRGILYVKDLLPLLGTPAAEQWQALIRPAYFVPESKRIHRLLKEFQDKHLHIAIVTDEYGGTAGIVTLQDVLEEIFGDLREANDPDTLTLAAEPDGSYLLEGRTSILDFAKRFQLDEETLETLRGESAHESLGGLLLDLAGEIPPVGYSVHLAGYRFTVHTAGPNAIHQLRVRPEPESED